jgi:hypothetical protein
MMILKIEQKALEKLRAKLKEIGINGLDDVLSPRRDVSEADFA